MRTIFRTFNLTMFALILVISLLVAAPALSSVEAPDLPGILADVASDTQESGETIRDQEIPADILMFPSPVAVGLTPVIFETQDIQLSGIIQSAPSHTEAELIAPCSLRSYHVGKTLGV